MPSYFSSKIQLGLSKGASARVASMGEARNGTVFIACPAAATLRIGQGLLPALFTSWPCAPSVSLFLFFPFPFSFAANQERQKSQGKNLSQGSFSKPSL